MLAGKGKMAAMKKAMAQGMDKHEYGKKPMKGKKPMPPMKKKGRDMGALAAFSKGNY